LRPTHAVILADPEQPASAAHIRALYAAIAAAAPDYSLAVTRSSPLLQRQPDALYCPLTLDLPPTLQTPVFRTCADVAGLQSWVTTNLGYDAGLGDRWLPIVLTARGPLYAEAIACDASGTYRQPWHLTDAVRQPLYRLAFELLDYLAAPPSVYMLAFAQRGPELRFDRLWPFPTASAIASLGVQAPDLFTCHWRCLTEAPILDLCIPGRYADAFKAF